MPPKADQRGAKAGNGKARDGLVLVNGAGGFLGAEVVRVLAESGYRVRATDLGDHGLAPLRALGADTVIADLLDPVQAKKVTQGAEAVVNVAGVFDFSLPEDLLYQGNVRVTEHMCKAALAAGVRRFVHVSTIGVYGTPAQSPMPEDGDKHPKNAYERTKLRGELEALRAHREHGLPVVVVRPALIYGPRGRYGLAPLIAGLASLAAAGRRDVYSIGGGPRIHNVHVEDVARAIEILLEHPGAVGNAYNCCDDEPLQWGEVFRSICEPLGLTRREIPWVSLLGRPLALALVRTPERYLTRWNDRLRRTWERAQKRFGIESPIRIRIDRDFVGYFEGDHVYDTSRLRRLGFVPRHPRFSTGIAEVIAWYRREGWIASPGPGMESALPETGRLTQR